MAHGNGLPRCRARGSRSAAGGAWLGIMAPVVRSALAFAVLLALAGAARASPVEEARVRVRAELVRQRSRVEALIATVDSRLALPGDAVDVVKVFGVPNDGGGGAAQAINRAIAAAAGRALFFPAGTYLLEDSIRPVTGTRLYFSPDAEMRRGFDGGNGDGRGALIQGAPSFAVEDVTVVGGVWTNPNHAYAGRVLTAIGRRWLVDSLRVTSWAPVRAPSSCVNLAGDDLTMRNCLLTGSAGRINQDGIRVMCGTRLRIADCYVESGDDCFCAFPTESTQGALRGHGLSDVKFARCAGVSTQARFLACGETAVTVLQGRAAMAQLNAVPVSGIHFVDCVGMSLAPVAHAPAFFVVSADTAPGAGVTGVRFTGCLGVGGPAAAQGALLNAAPGARCADLVLENCAVYGGQRETLTVTPTCSRVRIVDCVLDGVRTSRSQ